MKFKIHPSTRIGMPLCTTSSGGTASSKNMQQMVGTVCPVTSSVPSLTLPMCESLRPVLMSAGSSEAFWVALTLGEFEPSTPLGSEPRAQIIELSGESSTESLDASWDSKSVIQGDNWIVKKARFLHLHIYTTHTISLGCSLFANRDFIAKWIQTLASIVHS